ESFSYNASGDLTGTAAHSFGTTSSLVWNPDTSTLSCINTSGSTCTTPSSSQPQTVDYSYNGDGLRMSAQQWSGSTNSVMSTIFTWNGAGTALQSDGSMDY